jgi:uncharacterized metal-binding protein YceD (DUF177 family)
VDRLKQFDVSFGGLALGKHQFDFEVDNKFFASFEQHDVHQGSFTVKVQLTKQTHLLTFDFTITGSLIVECDRCIENFELPISTVEQMLVKFGDHAMEEDIDVYVIPASETQINLAHQIYEYIIVSIPMHIVHPDDAKGKSTCNAAVLKTLEKIQKVNKKIKEEKSDPRWDALRSLNN